MSNNDKIHAAHAAKLRESDAYRKAGNAKKAIQTIRDAKEIYAGLKLDGV